MDHFLKSFSVIDFLGIFAPGALVTLAYNYYLGGVTAPFTKFFNDQSITLVIYFVFLSYLVGILLQELSKPLEGIICYERKCHQEWQENPGIKALYQKIFKQPVVPRRQQGSSLFQRKNRGCATDKVRKREEKKHEEEVWLKIYRYVQPEIKEMKIPLFHAFASMARSCFLAALLIMAINWAAHILKLATATDILFTNLFCTIIAVLMLFRCRRFHKLVTNYSYISFLQMDNIDNKGRKEADKN